MNEATLHRQVCEYLKLQHPQIIFHSDFGSGIKLTMGQAMAQKRLQSSRSWPDLFLAEARGGWHGFFLELKREGTKIYLRNGEMTSNAHIREQDEMLTKLREKGYYAQFAVGLEDSVRQINHYLKSSDPVVLMEASRTEKLSYPIEAK